MTHFHLPTFGPVKDIEKGKVQSDIYLPPSFSLLHRSSPEYHGKEDSLLSKPKRCSGPPSGETKPPIGSALSIGTQCPPPLPPPEGQAELFLAGQMSSQESPALLLLLRKEQHCVSLLSTMIHPDITPGQEETKPMPNQSLDHSSHASKPLDTLSEAPSEAPPSLMEAMLTHQQHVMSSAHKQAEEPSFLSPKDITEKLRVLEEIISQTGLGQYRNSKLTKSEVLSLGPESLQDILLETEKDIPSYFLRNLMSLNLNARRTQPIRSQPSLGINNENVETNDSTQFKQIHPLDFLCVLLNLSDSFLQQEIVSKMSMCQFAVPLLLPACDGHDCTFMLWAMRDIVKKWRTQSLNKNGFREDSLVRIAMPVFSFVRLDHCSMSKSALLNQIISPPQRLLGFFMHQNMEGGDISKKLSNGLVEMSWNFPSGLEGLDVFAEPIAVANLRGDIMSNYRQFRFLNNISTAIFIFADRISEAEYQVLSGLKDVNTKYFFVVSLASETNTTTRDYLKKLRSSLNLDDKQILVKTAKVNDATLVKRLQFLISNLVHRCPRILALEEMKDIAERLAICVDENFEECQAAKVQAWKIINNISDVSQYKRENMKLQGDLWKQLSDMEKELCRMTKKQDEDGEHYKTKLYRKRAELLSLQNQHTPVQDIVAFKEMLNDSSPAKKHFFLKWMKILLDSLSRTNLSHLETEYRNQLQNGLASSEEMKTIDLKISESSLSVEHFIRELGQIYQAECSIQNDHTLNTTERRFSDIPGMAADLLLEGFPLELMDGDASNIPLQWISDILLELDKRTGGQCCLRVISVLGVQSTGKSTLLNTMFGLHLPVASGRCTRGAFMTLIRVKKNFQQEMGCHFILVIDTEGLKAPELASLENTYQHDNELATLVIGLSDITIVNVSMENTSDMQDVLQIVVHAFLRMKTVGKKPSCVFVHQNISDVSAHEKNRRDRQKLRDQLDEITNIVAKVENKLDIKGFSDVMELNIEKSSWYIPGLWYGVPPMAAVNSGYSIATHKLKIYLLQSLAQPCRRSQKFHDLSEWIKSLWNSIKHENFIFSFRNSLVAKVYNELSLKYSELQWNFHKAMDLWAVEAENAIRNKTTGNLQPDMYKMIIEEMYSVLDKEETVMCKSLDVFFKENAEHLSLLERYREDFQRSINHVKHNLKGSICKRLEEAIRTQKGKEEFEKIQKKLFQSITDKAGKIHRKGNHTLRNRKLDSIFEKIWKETLNESLPSIAKIQSINQTILTQLKKDLRDKVQARVLQSINRKKLSSYAGKVFEVKSKYIDKGHRNQVEMFHSTLKKKYDMLYQRCAHYVGEKSAENEDFNESYCQDLLSIINSGLSQDESHIPQTTPWFELEVKLLIFGKLAPAFQMMYSDFLLKNSLVHQLEKIKPQYFQMFQEICLEKNTSLNQIQLFCESCLKPALTGYFYNVLGREMVDDVLAADESRRYRSQALFQFSVLKELLENKNFSDYCAYIQDYEIFVKRWIVHHLEDKYNVNKGLEDLITKASAFIKTRVFEVLKDPSLTKNVEVSKFLFTFCDLLKKYLVISMDNTHISVLQGISSVEEFQNHFKLFTDKSVEDIKHKFGLLSFETVLSKLTLKPQDELFMKVFGCGKRCPFCKAPCEAEGVIHNQHFATVHRPQGLIGCRSEQTAVLSHSICSTSVVEGNMFLNVDTKGQVYSFKNYHMVYPDWVIPPDPSITTSDYWKFVLKEYNELFAQEYQAKPAEYPEEWNQITAEQAMKSLQESLSITMAVADDL